jgi:hypothetical protein
MTSALQEFRKWLANPDAPKFVYHTGSLLEEAKGEAKARLQELASEAWNAPVHLTQRRVGFNRFDYTATRVRKGLPERWSPDDMRGCE